MSRIKVSLLGVPSVALDGESVIFPYRKAEAIFYYLVIEKKATRDRLCDLFWDGVNDEVAKKNLRNALYAIRKVLFKDILISPSRSLVKINTDVMMETDIDWLYSNQYSYDGDINKQEEYLLTSKNNEILEGFNLKNAEGFQDWISATKENYKDLFIRYIHLEIKKALDKGDIRFAKKFCKHLINIDEFDEFAYRSLMIVYKLEKRYSECLSVYNNLQSIFQKELNIIPDKETRQLYQMILKEQEQSRRLDTEEESRFFYGRGAQLDELIDNHNVFMKSEEGSSVAIIGEVGVGKTTLADEYIHSISNDEVFVFKTACYRAEQDFLLKPWHRIFKEFYAVTDSNDIEIPPLLNKIIAYAFPRFEDNNMNVYSKLVELADFLKYQVVEHGVMDVFSYLAGYKKVIVYIDDIQWIDYMSLTLLKNMMIQLHNKRVLFVLTCRNSHSKSIEEFLSEMGMYGFIKRLKVDRFSNTETVDLFNELLSKANINSNEFENIIYNETKGNALFVMNFINNILGEKDVQMISPVLKDILESRLIDVSDEGKKLLDVVSVFPDKASIVHLEEILGYTEMGILEVVEELIQKNLIAETDSIDIAFKFTHPKLKKYILSKLSSAKRRILSSRINALLS